MRNPNGDVRESADREKRTADESEDNADAVLSVRELPSEHKLYLVSGEKFRRSFQSHERNSSNLSVCLFVKTHKTDVFLITPDQMGGNVLL